MGVKFQLRKCRHKFWICVLATLITITSCNQKENKLLHHALKLSGTNRPELEKVFNHYKDDTLKLKAARFLITNMYGSFSQNKEILNLCAPFYEEYNALAKEYNYTMNADRGQKIDSLWNAFSTRNPQLRSLPFQLDLETISAKQLISEIDLAFSAWQENVYTKNCSFDEFCEYILPYRRVNGLVIDSARTRFHDRHKRRYFTQPGKDMIDEADSLLYQYRHITYSRSWGIQVPILNASTLECLRHGLCTNRCWYNSLLFSSLGMAIAIDFVPAWGNRYNDHSWNVLIKDGESFAFEPFWDQDRWKYKRIYNNKTFDYIYGRFRAPKIYRHTFKNYFDGPITDTRVDIEDIPPLFRNFKKKDVSHEYFDTANVSVPLSNLSENVYYAYLCVWSANGWRPVQWGRIKKNKAVFKGMGKDIVYLPCYYINKSLNPAGEPFLLNESGEIEYFNSDLKDTEDLCIKHYGSQSLLSNLSNHLIISGTVVKGSCDRSFKKSDTLCVFPDSVEIYGDKIGSYSNRTVRYIRLSLPSKTLAYSDLSFFQRDSEKKEKKINHVKLVHPLDSIENGEQVSYIFDEYKSTGYIKELNKNFIDIDLGAEYCISSVDFTPYIDSGLKKEFEFELFYWNNGWQSIQKQMGTGKHMIYKDVPKNALFILLHQDKNNRQGSRLFIYRDKEILWY
ncbi:MAG: hypothetical protein PHP81_03700 [Patescibacteria group bacterium]|nr:hypothetical protein [Patescibacteria group bacterium]